MIFVVSYFLQLFSCKSMLKGIGIAIVYAPVAQLDRVFGYEPKGRGFESLRACQVGAGYINACSDFLLSEHICVLSLPFKIFSILFDSFIVKRFNIVIF